MCCRLHKLKWFSQRKGLKKVRTEIQVGSMDKALRNRLWNLLTSLYWSTGQVTFPDFLRSDITKEMSGFLANLWHSFFKESFDSLAGSWDETLEKIREYYFKCRWFEIYDFVEFVANIYPNKDINNRFMKACNKVLEEDLSAYRFVGKQITQITSEKEISEIEEAVQTPLTPVKAHLEEALKLMSDRKSPDYRNSIKESISAVEAICRLITKNNKATLGQALKEVETKVGLHGALKKAFSNLYGYTSSAEGIRHALLDEPKLSFEDAKFMLVSCSAFVNYLISKATKAGVKMG